MATEESLQQELFSFATAAEPSSETPSEAPSEAPAETPAEAAPEAPQSAPAAEAQPSQTESIPSWRLREEADARRAAEDRERQLQARLTQIETHMRQQAPDPKKPAPNWFEDPQGAMQAAMEAYFQPIRAEQHRYFMQMSRSQAEIKHGADNVALAEKVFMEAKNKGILDPMDFERVVQAPNRFDACVEWYKRLHALHTVGTDPNAWWQKQFEERMADPKFQAEVMEKIRGSAAARPAATKLPPSLSKSTAAASNGEGSIGDMTNESLWQAAMK